MLTNPYAHYGSGYGYGHAMTPYPGMQPAGMQNMMSPQAMQMQGVQGVQSMQAMPATLPAFDSGFAVPSVPSGSAVTPAGGSIVQVPAVEESYIENILRLNRGKLATVYMTFENNSQWNAKVFKGVIEAAGRDHIILSDPNTGMRYLLLMINLDYITFDEPIAYEYPFMGGVVTNATPSATTATGGTSR